MSIRSVTITIKSCEKCPNCRVTQDSSLESSEHLQRWDCYHKSVGNGLNIKRQKMWIDQDDYIPDWCPLLGENSE